MPSGYTLSDVRVTLDEQGNITLHRVKFARMMPVRVDVLIPEVKCQQVNGQTTLSGDSRRVNVGKNRTRTAVQRTLIQNHQPSFIIFRGKERLESSPFAASAGSTYYVYALRRILC